MEYFDNVVPFNDLLTAMRIRQQKLNKAIEVLEENETTINALNQTAESNSGGGQRKQPYNKRSEAQRARWARVKASERKAA